MENPLDKVLTTEGKRLLGISVSMTIADLEKVIIESNDKLDQEWAKERIGQYEEIREKLDLPEE